MLKIPFHSWLIKQFLYKQGENNMKKNYILIILSFIIYFIIAMLTKNNIKLLIIVTIIFAILETMLITWNITKNNRKK